MCPKQQILMLSVARSLCEAKHNDTKVNYSSLYDEKEQQLFKKEIPSGFFDKRNNLDVIFFIP